MRSLKTPFLWRKHDVIRDTVSESNLKILELETSKQSKKVLSDFLE